MLQFRFDCKYSGNFKGLFPPNLGHCILVGAFFMHKSCKRTNNFDFQGSVKLYFKRQFYLSGMNLTELSSVL